MYVSGSFTLTCFHDLYPQKWQILDFNMLKVSFNYANKRKRDDINHFDDLFEVEGVRNSNRPRFSLNPI